MSVVEKFVKSINDFLDELLWTMYCLFKAVYIVFPEFIGFLALIFGCALGCLVLP